MKKDGHLSCLYPKYKVGRIIAKFKDDCNPFSLTGYVVLKSNPNYETEAVLGKLAESQSCAV